IRTPDHCQPNAQRTNHIPSKVLRNAETVHTPIQEQHKSSVKAVAHALMRAASRLISTPACEFRSTPPKRRDESRRGTQECVRHDVLQSTIRVPWNFILVECPTTHLPNQ